MSQTIQNIGTQSGIRRLAITAMKLIGQYAVDKHPSLRTPESIRAFDDYDSLLSDCIEASMHGGWSKSEAVRSFPVIEAGHGLALALEDQCLTLRHALAEHTRDTATDISAAPVYLRHASVAVTQCLDMLIEALDLATPVMVEAAALTVEAAATLRDTLADILHKTRSKGGPRRSLRIPQMFRKQLRPMAATKRVRKYIVTPLTASEKRKIIGWAEHVSMDGDIEIDAAVVTRLYERAMKDMESKLRKGVLPTVLMSAILVTKKGRFQSLRRARPAKFLIHSRKDRDKAYSVTMTIDPAKGHFLTYKCNLKRPALATILKAWVSGAEKVMEGAMDDPDAEVAFAIEQLNRSLTAALPKFKRSFLRGEVTAELSMGNEGSLLLIVTAIRTAEHTVPKNEAVRHKRLMELWATNRALMGTRKDIEKLASALAKKYNYASSSVQQVREKHGSYRSFGYKMLFNLPNMLKDARGMISMIKELLWGIGKGRMSTSEEEQANLQKFLKDFGTASDKASLKKMRSAVSARRLITKVQEMLGGATRYPPRLRTELEKLVSLLEEGYVSKTGEIETLSKRVDQISKQYSRTSSTDEDATDTVDIAIAERTAMFDAIRDLVVRNIPSEGRTLKERCISAGMDESQIPTIVSMSESIAHSICADITGYGMIGPNHTSVFRTAGGTLDDIITNVQGNGVSFCLWGTEQGFEVHGHITAAFQEKVADLCY